MLAYKVITTVLDSLLMLMIVMMEKGDRAVSIMSLIVITILAMNIGLIWH